MIARSAPVAGSRRAVGDVDGTEGRRLIAAVGAAAALAVIAAIVLAGAPILGPGDVLPLLVATAGLCAALLARDVAPSLAWLAMIGASLAAASVSIDAARGLDPGRLGVGPWEVAAFRSSVAAVTTLAIAATYATGRRRRLEPIAPPVALGLLGWLVLACVVTLGAVAAGVPSDPAFTWVDVATLPIKFFLHFVVVVVALGIAGDLRAATERARLRMSGVATGSRPERSIAAVAATVRELWPGQADLAESTRAAERTRLAGDLHAVVLPSLRRAIAEAEAGGDPDVLARHLRAVDLDLERLMADRWPVVLEAFGLVAALEDLAERIEAGGGPRIELDVERVGERPPISIERTAWRVAQIAIDNVVRHAAATAATITIDVSADRVALAIADDGRGFVPGAGGGRRTAGRGLADAVGRAAAVGATLGVTAEPGQGTRITFEWRAAGRA